MTLKASITTDILDSYRKYGITSEEASLLSDIYLKLNGAKVWTQLSQDMVSTEIIHYEVLCNELKHKLDEANNSQHQLRANQILQQDLLK